MEVVVAVVVVVMVWSRVVDCVVELGISRLRGQSRIQRYPKSMDHRIGRPSIYKLENISNGMIGYKVWICGCTDC